MKKLNGYIVKVYKDLNVYSLTYGEEREETEYDPVSCPPDTSQKKEQSITWEQDIETLTVGDSIALIASASSGLVVSFSIESGSEFAHITDGILYADKVGSFTINAYQNGNDEYYEAPLVTKTIKVKSVKKEQTITWEQTISLKVGDSVTLNASSDSGLDVSYEIVEGSEFATIDGNVLKGVKYGSVVLRAKQDGNDEYDAATPIEKSFKVEEQESVKKDQDITWGQEFNLHIGETISLTATASSGLDITYKVISGSDYATLEGNKLSGVKYGTVIVEASQGGNDEYNAAVSIQKAVTVQKKEQTITWSQDLSNVIVGDTISLNATSDSGLDITYSVLMGESLITLSGNELTANATGQVIINAEQSGNDEYGVATTVQKSFVISEKQIGTNGRVYIDFYNDHDDDTNKYYFAVKLPINGVLTTMFETDDLVTYAKNNNYKTYFDFDNLSGEIKSNCIVYEGDTKREMIKSFYFRSLENTPINISNLIGFSDIFSDFTRGKDLGIIYTAPLFSNCENLIHTVNLYANDWNIASISIPFNDMSNVTHMDNMFYNCYNLKTIQWNNIHFNTNADARSMFEGTARDVDGLTIYMKGSTEEERAFIKQAWIDSENDENKLTIIYE